MMFNEQELDRIAALWGMSPDEAAAIVATAERDAAVLGGLAPARLQALQADLLRESEIATVRRIVGLSPEQTDELREIMADAERHDQGKQD